MAGGKPTIYWDTCIWLAWIKNENRDPNDMAGVQEQIDRFENGEISIATCVVTLCEMLDLKTKLSAVNYKKLQQTFYRRDLIRIAVDIRVAEITRELRDFYYAQHLRDGFPTLELGDAIHLAAAIHYGVTEFATFDERDSKKPSKPRRGLLSLNGNVGGHNLIIVKPYTTRPAQLPLVMAVPVKPVPPPEQTDADRPDDEKQNATPTSPPEGQS
jgi:predicted nucleic acid-binding protein